MNSLEPPYNGIGSGGGTAILGHSHTLMGEYMKGGADPLLSQDPHSVLPSYSSSADSEASTDFPEDKLMPSSSLYSLYLLQPNSGSGAAVGSEIKSLENNHGSCGTNSERRNSRGSDTEENIDVLTLDNQTRQPSTNGVDHDALFEGMPFYELKGREVGPCTYCTMWRAIKFLSHCGNYPFCSVCCTKKFAVCKRERGELLEKSSKDLNTSQKIKVPTLFEEHKPQPMFPPRHDLLQNHRHSKPVSVNGSTPSGQRTNGHCLEFDWSTYLQEHDTEAAPVRCFCHAPLSLEWKGSLTGAMVEVHNRDPEESPDSFWVARIIQMGGYKARLRFEGYGMDSSHDFSLHLLMAECYPVNGAVKMGRVMKPPKGVLDRLGNNWQEHLARVAHSGSPTITLPRNKEYLECKFKKGMRLEVVYKRQISQTCVASISKTVANRLHVQYENCKDPSKDFWFHQSSPWIHPVGWSQRVGHPIIATAAYKSEALDKGRHKKAGPQDAPWDIFNIPTSHDESQFRVGMKLEVVDPLKLGTICVATVMQVLKEGNLMIGVDGCLDDSNGWFCCHSTSPSLLHVGFCEYHKIDLQPPRGYENRFDWDDYLKITESVAAPIEVFHQKTVDRGFKVGHKLEAVDLIESGFICVATVTKVAGPLLRVHFDGWDRSFDQWMDCDSPDIYPVGWCEMVSYPLQPPRIHESQDFISITPVCKPASRRKHHPSGEKRRMSLTATLESMSKEHGSDPKKILPSVYSFSDEETGLDSGVLPPPPKKQILKKPNLKLKMPRHSKKHNGKGRPKDPATHHNYAMPSTAEGSVHPTMRVEPVCEPRSSSPSGSNQGGLLNGYDDKAKTAEKTEFIVEVDSGVVSSRLRGDTSLSSLDSPPLSADSSTGSLGINAPHEGHVDAKEEQTEPVGKFTMKNWSHVQHKHSSKILTSRPFKQFAAKDNSEKDAGFGMETYEFDDGPSAPAVTIPSVSKSEKKKKKKKKSKKKKDKEKEKHKKDGSSSKKKKSKSDKERRRERRKEKAKEKQSRITALLNLPAQIQMDQSKQKEETSQDNLPSSSAKSIAEVENKELPSKVDVHLNNERTSKVDDTTNIEKAISVSKFVNMKETVSLDKTTKTDKYKLKQNVAKPITVGFALKDRSNASVSKDTQSSDYDPYQFDVDPCDVPTLPSKEECVRTERTKEKAGQDKLVKVEQVPPVSKNPAPAVSARAASRKKFLNVDDEVKRRLLQTRFIQEKLDQLNRSRRPSSGEVTPSSILSPTDMFDHPLASHNGPGSMPIANLPSPQSGLAIPKSLSTAEALAQSLLHRTEPPRPPPPPMTLPIRPDLPSPTQLSPSHPGMFSGFRSPLSRDICNMVALSRPPREFRMPVSAQSPSPTAVAPRHPHPPQMSPTSIPGPSPPGVSPPGMSRPPPMYGAHLSRTLPVHNAPRSPLDHRQEFMSLPPHRQQQMMDALFQQLTHSQQPTPQRLPPLQSLLMQQRYPPPPPPPHPQSSTTSGMHSLGSPQMGAVPPAHTVASPHLPPPPYNFHQAMTSPQPGLPSPARRQTSTGSTGGSSSGSQHTSPSTPSDRSPVSEQPAALPGVTDKGVNPWEWGIPEVMQFLVEAGEGSCAECFCRQKIDGQKLMSLTKEQIAKLTGMKVAPSLKIYEQIVKLRSMFPSSTSKSKLQGESVVR